MKRKVILFVTLFAFLFLANVSAKTCCCEYDIFKGDGSIWKQTCGMSHQTGEDCEVLCNDEYGEDRITGVFENWACNSTERCQPYCGNGVIESGEKCEIGQNTCKEDEVCDRCQCRSVEICNGKDDDKDNYVDESNDCEDSQCYAEGDCPLGYVCMKETIEAAMVGRTITGMAGETGQCQICKSVCKVCPPHPPEATENNPLGICAPESQGGYPMSKNCLDWKNKVSCGTCVDKDGDGKRETFEPRKNDGNFGVDKDGKPIFSKGDKVECSVEGCTFPKIEKPENNKDFKAGDEVIDCRLVIPVITSNLPDGDVMSEKLALTGVCSTFESGGDILCRPRPLSSCMTDCYWEYEVGWKSWTKKLSEDNIKEGDGDDVMLTEQCPDSPKNSKNARTNLAMKKDGSWGQLLSENGADCAVKYKSWWYTKCKTWNGNAITPIPTEDLQKRCIEYVKVEGGNEKNAYFWSMLKGTQTDCFCKKADIELKIWPDKKSYALFELKSKTEMACANPNSFNCPLAVISVLQDRNAPQDEVASAFASLKEWVSR